MRRRRNNKQRKILVFSAMALLLIMTAGYAAFNTQINITAKGNIVKKKAAQQLIANVVDTGDGLYADSVTEGRYFYRGTTVDNYITFNNETWRIISVEADGTLKIIRNEQLSSRYALDSGGARSSSTSTYCTDTSEYGCNAWAATVNLVGTPSVFTQYSQTGNPTTDTEIYSGTVTQDASLNTYLNGEYYNSLTSTAQSKVVTGTFNVSTPGGANDTETLEVDAEQEKQYRWQGKIALMTVTELLRASTNSACTSLDAVYGQTICNSNNWLWPTFNTYIEEVTLSPINDGGTNSVWRAVLDDGYLGHEEYMDSGTAGGSSSIRPVLHLSSDITLSGSGTSSSQYTID